VALFLSLPLPCVLCFLWLYSHRIPPLPGNQSTVISGVMVVVGSWGVEEDEQCWETAPCFGVLCFDPWHFKCLQSSHWVNCNWTLASQRHLHIGPWFLISFTFDKNQPYTLIIVRLRPWFR
jgi:hypothetical protein